MTPVADLTILLKPGLLVIVLLCNFYKTVHTGFSKKLQLNLWLHCVSGLSFFNIPGYVTMDAKLAWKPIKNTEFFVVGQNLFSQYHRESQSDFIPSLAAYAQRGVYAGVEWRY
jgi:iron complex outermembrane receptor protein